MRVVFLPSDEGLPMEQKGENQRGEERVSASLPVELGAATGVTRDFSASGIFFETDATFALGNEIRFSVELDAPGGKLMLRCQGSIVRLEPRENRVGVAVKITASRLEALGSEQAPEGSASRAAPVA